MANRNRRRRRKKGNPLYRRATRDVRVSMRPYLQELRRTRRQGVRDYRQGVRQVSNAYGALQGELAPLGGQLSGQLAGVRSGLQGDLAGLADMLGSTVPGVPEGEITAGAGLFGSLGAGALSELASQGARVGAYQSSAQRQGSIEEMIARRNMTQDKLNFLDDLRQQRLDAMRGMAPEIRSRLDYLRDLAFDRMSANRSFGLQQSAFQSQQASDAAWAWYTSQLAGQYGGGRP